MLKTLVTATALSTLLSACVVAPYPRHVVYAEPVPIAVDGNIYADVPPPEPYAEVVPAIPYAGAVWIGGYWGWHGGRHQWVAGRWEHGRPGYQWHPHSWVAEGGRWHLREGGWVRH